MGRKPKNPKIQKDIDGAPKVDRRKFNKRSPKSGRKPKEQTLLERGIKKYLEDHTNEEVEVEIEITDPKTNQKRKIKKPRVVIVMEHLYAIGIGNTEKGSSAALKEWLDRALGKAPQPIRGDGDDSPPVRLEVDITKMLSKAYDR